MIIRKASIGDVPQILKLVNAFAKKGVMLERSEDGVLQNLRDYFVAIDSRSRLVVGCAALHIYTSRLSEIKSLAVKKIFQKHGIGKRLIKRCLREAKDLGLTKVFALTYVVDFFKNLGFQNSEKSQLPDKIWEECYRCPRRENCDEICLLYLV